MATLQKSFLVTGGPIVHGWVFDLETGELKDLEIDFDTIVTAIAKINDLGLN